MGAGAADSRQEDPFCEGLGDLKLLALEAERPSHAAAAGVEQGNPGSGAAEEVELGAHLHDGFVVAMAVEDDALPGEVRGSIIGRVPGEEIAQEIALAAEPGSSRVLREEVTEFVAKNAGARGFEEDDGEAGVDFGSQSFKNALEVAACSGQEAEVIKRAAAAEMSGRELDAESGGLQHGLSCGQRLRVVVVVPGVGPEEDAPGARSRRGARASAAEAARREERQMTLWGNSENGFDRVAEAGQPQRQIGKMRCESGNSGCKARPLVHEAEGIVTQMVPMMLVVVREKFGLIGGHVYADRALGFAGFAGEAKVERFLDGLALPFTLEHVSFQHFP